MQFVNHNHQSYTQELLLMIEQNLTPILFGLVLPVKYSVNNEEFAIVRKDLKHPLPANSNHIVGMFNLSKTHYFLVYENALILIVENEDNYGFLS